MSLDAEMEEIIPVFLEESFEGLDTMESCLLTLDAQANPEAINTIFRAAHSIKGGASSFGFSQIATFTHSVETLLDEMRNARRAVTADAVQILLQAVDVMRDMLRCVQAKRPISAAGAEILGGELARILEENRAPTGTAAAADAEPCPSSTTPGEAEGWRIAFTPDLTMLKTCNDPLRIFAGLGKWGEVQVTPHIDLLPPFPDLDPTMCYLAWTIIVQGAATRMHIAEAFEWVDTAAKLEIEPLTTSAAVPSVLHCDVPHTDSSAPTNTALPSGSVASLEATPMSSAAPKSGVDSSIRVATEKVDALINLVGELVITQSMLGSVAECLDSAGIQALRRGLAQLARNTRELQEGVMHIRMLPISFCFNRLPRLVHELSRKLGKKVDLKVSGEGTELDKTVLEKIGDPLVHLVRNALDHGLELPDARVAAGKSATGTLSLNAFHEGGNIIVEVKDDGAGLNKARILAKAQERGLVEAGEELTDTQIYNLIFTAGFSTAATVNDVSGRGVGMDVVKRNINDLGGHVQILSTEGIGSTIRIRLPLTLAILEGQMLRVGKEIYVASLLSIIETVQPARVHLSRAPGGIELFRHRDAFIPIIRLHELFEAIPDSQDIAEGLLVIVEADGHRAAILVDELLAQQQVVIKSLETHFKQVPGLTGATIHGNGSVALILDVPGLMSRFRERRVRSQELAA